jgi:hypothetical protein
MKAVSRQRITASAEEAKQGGDAHARNPCSLMWAEVLLWLERLLLALVTASRGVELPLPQVTGWSQLTPAVISETVSMQKPPTGEPYAGKPPVRFGGRGRRKPVPTPIENYGTLAELTLSQSSRDTEFATEMCESRSP